LFRLETLNVSMCNLLSNDALYYLAQNRLSLRHLDLSGNENITDDGLEVLCEGCQELRTIRLKGKRKYFQYIDYTFDVLLHLLGCERLSLTCITHCANSLPFCVLQPCEFSATIESLTDHWISIFTQLIKEYECANFLQFTFRKWKQKMNTISTIARRKRQREKIAAVKIQRWYRRHLAVSSPYYYFSYTDKFTFNVLVACLSLQFKLGQKYSYNITCAGNSTW